MKTLVHRFWVGPRCADHDWITRTVQQAHPAADVADWTLDALPADLRAQVDADDSPGHLSNVVRYWSLFEYGGLWLDHDVIPLRDLTGAPAPWMASLRGLREGSAMWFPVPGHPMMAEMLAIALASTKGLPPPARSGGRFLRLVGTRYPDVGYEERVLPVDAAGRRTVPAEVWAVHLWRETSIRHSATPSTPAAGTLPEEQPEAGDRVVYRGYVGTVNTCPTCQGSGRLFSAVRSGLAPGGTPLPRHWETGAAAGWSRPRP